MVQIFHFASQTTGFLPNSIDLPTNAERMTYEFSLKTIPTAPAFLSGTTNLQVYMMNIALNGEHKRGWKRSLQA